MFIRILCRGESEMERFEKYKLPKKTRNVFLIIIATIILQTIFVYFFPEVKNYRPSNVKFVDFIFSTIVLVGFLAITYLFYELGKYYLEKEKVFLLQKHIDEASENILRLREKKHKYYSSLLESQQKMISILESHQSITNELEQLDDTIFQTEPVFCKNGIVDAVIVSKSNEMKKHHIDFQCTIELLDDFIIKPIELSAIVFNLLDNAIRASQSSNISNPYIQLEIKQKFKIIKIKVENSFDSTQKEIQRNGHGYGLQIIQDIVDSYHGEIKIFKNDVTYEAVLYLGGINQ